MLGQPQRAWLIPQLCRGELIILIPRGGKLRFRKGDFPRMIGVEIATEGPDPNPGVSVFAITTFPWALPYQIWAWFT